MAEFFASYSGMALVILGGLLAFWGYGLVLLTIGLMGGAAGGMLGFVTGQWLGDSLNLAQLSDKLIRAGGFQFFLGILVFGVVWGPIPFFATVGFYLAIGLHFVATFAAGGLIGVLLSKALLGLSLADNAGNTQQLQFLLSHVQPLDVVLGLVLGVVSVWLKRVAIIAGTAVLGGVMIGLGTSRWIGGWGVPLGLAACAGGFVLQWKTPQLAKRLDEDTKRLDGAMEKRPQTTAWRPRVRGPWTPPAERRAVRHSIQTARPAKRQKPAGYPKTAQDRERDHLLELFRGVIVRQGSMRRNAVSLRVVYRILCLIKVDEPIPAMQMDTATGYCAFTMVKYKGKDCRVVCYWKGYASVAANWGDGETLLGGLQRLVEESNRLGAEQLTVVISLDGWSPDVVAWLRKKKPKRLLLVSGSELHSILQGRYSWADLLDTKIDALATRSDPYCAMS